MNEVPDEYQIASLTCYNADEDQFGRVTAKPNGDGKFLAIQGITIAVDPRLIPFGSKVLIPELKDFSKNKDGIFLAHDTGSAVKAKLASIRRGVDYPVIDVFVDVPTRKLCEWNTKLGMVARFKIIP